MPAHRAGKVQKAHRCCPPSPHIQCATGEETRVTQRNAHRRNASSFIRSAVPDLTIATVTAAKVS
ncbi:MAG: hypothetical protein A4E40_00642 [Methanoregulaceae archaeon PtaU1.Bin059]|nr:MAG: hypothetical protein A4E39_01883 [Methanoregulaceae archaeon PtaB.Bin152]OPY41259.1 MAG: hypothetical protein A4E40_00642 [Methanoregulaceae archaeon PtaU1.Bin059]